MAQLERPKSWAPLLDGCQVHEPQGWGICRPSGRLVLVLGPACEHKGGAVDTVLDAYGDWQLRW